MKKTSSSPSLTCRVRSVLMIANYIMLPIYSGSNGSPLIFIKRILVLKYDQNVKLNKNEIDCQQGYLKEYINMTIKLLIYY